MSEFQITPFQLRVASLSMMRALEEQQLELCSTTQPEALPDGTLENSISAFRTRICGAIMSNIFDRLTGQIGNGLPTDVRDALDKLSTIDRAKLTINCLACNHINALFVAYETFKENHSETTYKKLRESGYIQILRNILVTWQSTKDVINQHWASPKDVPESEMLEAVEKCINTLC